jgi:oligopeptide/dipeptide ABC transporter ATP-binding protein
VSATTPLLRVENLVKHFPLGRRAAAEAGSPVVHALCGVSFELDAGQTLGIVGESGSGKTTLLKTILGLHRPSSGAAYFEGTDIVSARGRQRREMKTNLSVVFQDPYTSLDPRMTIAEVLAEPAFIHGDRRGVARRSREVLDSVKLSGQILDRFPHEFSGGQRQRIAIARALMLNPKLVVLDEPVSALDVSVQAEILTLLADLQRETNVSYLFVAHDLAVVAQLCDRIGVMYGGQLLEIGTTEEIVHRPQHPYTRELLAAVPVPDPVVERARAGRSLERSWPSATSPMPNCPFPDIR